MDNSKKLALKPSIVATDIVLFTFSETLELLYLVIPLSKELFPKETFGLPGGVIFENETAEESVQRNLFQKAGVLDVSFMEQLVTMSALNRDPRSRVVSIAYIGFLNPDQFQKNKNLNWISVDEKIKLGFDHNQIVSLAITRLRDKVVHSTFIKYLLPEVFTMATLQESCEAILGESVDKRNFRKKILQDNILEEKGIQKGLKHRPATLYSFRKER